MKELSIEEKAKAYDEALEKARLVLQERGDEPDGAALLSKLFPHLRESDDERIKKELLEHIKYCSESIPERAAYIAWLEKQGEHANFCNKIQIGDKVTRNRDGVLVNLSQLNRVAKKDEKQSEQKPTDMVEPKFKIGDTMRTLIEAKCDMTVGMPVVVSIDDKNYHCTNETIAIKDQDDYEYPPMNRKQNPAWSEEDEKKRTLLISILEVNYPNEYFKVNPANTLNMEAMHVKELVDWLKSLRPQSQWKPSDEQMDNK